MSGLLILLTIVGGALLIVLLFFTGAIALSLVPAAYHGAVWLGGILVLVTIAGLIVHAVTAAAERPNSGDTGGFV